MSIEHKQQEISILCSKALQFDQNNQFKEAAVLYGQCIQTIGHLMASHSLNQLRENDNLCKSILAISSKCTQRLNELIQFQSTEQSQQHQHQQQQQQQQNRTFKPFQEMSVEELTQAMIDLDGDLVVKQQQLEELMKHKANRRTIAELSSKYEQTKLLRSQMEQYLQQIIHRRDLDEKRKSAASSISLSNPTSLVNSFISLTNTSSHSVQSVGKIDHWTQLMMKHFVDYKKRFEIVSSDQHFLERFPIVNNVQHYIVKHIRHIIDQGAHPLSHTLRAFSLEITEKHMSANELVTTIKSFTTQLTEYLTIQWTTLVPISRNTLYLSRHQGSESSQYLLHLPLLEAVLEMNYNFIMSCYNNLYKKKNDRIRELNSASLTLNEMVDTEPYCMKNISAPYCFSISALSELLRLRLPNDQIQAIGKSMKDVGETIRSYCDRTGLLHLGSDQRSLTLVHLYIIIQSKVFHIYSICRYIEDFCTISYDSSVLINMRSAVDMSFNFEPTTTVTTTTTKKETANSILDDFIMTVRDDELSDVDASTSGEDILHGLDMDGINHSLEDKMTMLMSSSTRSEIDELKKQLSDRDDQLLYMAEERDKLVANFLQQIQFLSEQLEQQSKRR